MILQRLVVGLEAESVSSGVDQPGVVVRAFDASMESQCFAFGITVKDYMGWQLDPFGRLEISTRTQDEVMSDTWKFSSGKRTGVGQRAVRLSLAEEAQSDIFCNPPSTAISFSFKVQSEKNLFRKLAWLPPPSPPLPTDAHLILKVATAPHISNADHFSYKFYYRESVIQKIRQANKQMDETEKNEITLTSHFSFHCWKSLKVFVSVGSCTHWITWGKISVMMMLWRWVGGSSGVWPVGWWRVSRGRMCPARRHLSPTSHQWWRHQLGPSSRILKAGTKRCKEVQAY